MKIHTSSMELRVKVKRVVAKVSGTACNIFKLPEAEASAQMKNNVTFFIALRMLHVFTIIQCLLCDKKCYLVFAIWALIFKAVYPKHKPYYTNVLDVKICFEKLKIPSFFQMIKAI